MSNIALVIVLVIGISLIIASLILRYKTHKGTITALNLLEKVMGGKIYAPAIVVDVNFDEYDFYELIRANSMVAPSDQAIDRKIIGNYELSTFLEEVKTYADSMIPSKLLKTTDGRVAAGTFLCSKGRAKFALSFRTYEVRVTPELIPQHLKQFVFESPHAAGVYKMHVLHQAVFTYPNNGHEVKDDMIDQCISASQLPEEYFERPVSLKGRISRFAYDSMSESLYVQQMPLDPTVGYIDLLEDRLLTLHYRGDSYQLDQKTVLRLLAEQIIPDEKATIILDGSPGSGKTAFLSFLQKKLAQNSNIDNIILGNGLDLKTFVSQDGKGLQMSWTNSAQESLEKQEIPKLQVLCFDDAAGILEDHTLSQDLASIMDGQIKNLASLVPIFLVNRPLKNVPEDLKRSGRMSVVVEFPQLTGEEASKLAHNIAAKIHPPKTIDPNAVHTNQSYTVASVYEMIHNTEVEDGITLALQKAEEAETSTTTEEIAAFPAQTTVAKPQIRQARRRKK